MTWKKSPRMNSILSATPYTSALWTAQAIFTGSMSMAITVGRKREGGRKEGGEKGSGGREGRGAGCLQYNSKQEILYCDLSSQ